MTEFVEGIFGTFEEKNFRNKTIIGIIGAIVFMLFLHSQGNLPSEAMEKVFYFFISFGVVIGISYGIHIIRRIASGALFMGNGEMAWFLKWMFIAFAILIGAAIGGILYIVDFIRWISFKVSNGQNKVDEE